ncbi:MAG: proton-conducting transporter membrane subunit [Thermodesulfobacteriota bacterium]
MGALFLSLLILASGALASAVLARTRARGTGPAFAVAGALAAAASGASFLAEGLPWEISFPWAVPLGSFSLGMDGLSCLFVLLISVVGALAAIYGRGYLEGEDPGKAAMSWCWYNLLLASMLVVVTARDGFLFLMAWEAMSLSSFFLVMYDHQKNEVVRAGWIYLAATHLGTAFLLVMFLLLGSGGGLSFALLSATGPAASVVFVAALVGFGTKAGFVPMHFWLPEAHPAAPSHVSALMSGVMIKTGIYGILRVMTFLHEPLAWWGWALVAVGAVSGIAGVLFALAQHDLKRLLAYHSVENIGIIALGLGLGVLGTTAGNPFMAALGFCGGLLHVVNHGLFKSLLFLGAGSVLHATGTRDLDRMGGLIKRMPVSGATFLVGAAAICGLPPLNGFVSEFLIYASGFYSVSADAAAWGGLCAIAGLALIGGLALACFTKAFGIVFLGEPRSDAMLQAHEGPWSMQGPMIALAALCAAVGLGGVWAMRLVLPAAALLAPGAAGMQSLGAAPELLVGITLGAVALAALSAALLWLRARLLRGRSVRESVTWDCGYAAPTARMQYTASSFAHPTVGMFRLLLRTRTELHPPEGLFPERASIHTHTGDVFVGVLFAPATALLLRLADRFRQLQQGRTHLYILYIVVCILILFLLNLV